MVGGGETSKHNNPGRTDQGMRERKWAISVQYPKWKRYHYITVVPRDNTKTCES